MNTVFYREQKSDPRLTLELYATSDGYTRLDSYPITPLSLHLYEREEQYVAVAAQMHGDVYAAANDFFHRHRDTSDGEGKVVGVAFALHFDGGTGEYFLGYPFSLSFQGLTDSRGIMHFVLPQRPSLVRGTDAMADPRGSSLPPRTAEEERLVEEAVREIMAMQEAAPPRPLTALERMRRGATRRFAGGGSSPAPAAGQGRAEPAAENAKIFDPSCLKITPGAADPDKELERIVGLDSVKREFDKMKASLIMQKERAVRLGLTASVHSGHMCFMGAPGTGKTTMARLVAGVLFNMGMIRRNVCVEISGLDLLANYLGQTAIKTQATVDFAKGGVLFIDEAYAITSSSYGAEAVGVLLKEMEDNRDGLVVILAGYEKDMERLLNLNQGFRSRINRYFNFENYTVPELAKLYLFNLRSRNLRITEEALRKSLYAFTQEVKSPYFSNGRFVRNFTEQVEDRHVIRVHRDPSPEELNLIRAEDISEKE
ncbi:MAG: AAA family ATPase [Clostridia bacterium]|nr:AAA family ATPase [Clostridia bacterium]